MRASRSFSCLALAACVMGGGAAAGGGVACGDGGREATGEVSPLLRPDSPEMKAVAPDSFLVRFDTSEGEFAVRVRRAWAPRGADRFYNLVRHGFYDGARFFRVLDGFVAQFGIHGDPRVSAAWREATIADDPVVASNERGTLAFAAGRSANTRTTQVFVNYRDSSELDAMGFAPFGEVVAGMEVVDRLHSGYGEGAPSGRGPEQARIQFEGNSYLEREFPDLDYIERAVVEEGR